jgi:hypothetical protein
VSLPPPQCNEMSWLSDHSEEDNYDDDDYEMSDFASDDELDLPDDGGENEKAKASEGTHSSFLPSVTSTRPMQHDASTGSSTSKSSAHEGHVAGKTKEDALPKLSNPPDHRSSSDCESAYSNDDFDDSSSPVRDESLAQVIQASDMITQNFLENMEQDRADKAQRHEQQGERGKEQERLSTEEVQRAEKAEEERKRLEKAAFLREQEDIARRQRLEKEEQERERKKLEKERQQKLEQERKRQLQERLAKEKAEAEAERARERMDAMRIEKKKRAKEREEKKAEEERRAKEREEKKAEEERRAKEREEKKAEEERRAREREEKKAEEERRAKEREEKKAEEERRAKEREQKEARRREERDAEKVDLEPRRDEEELKKLGEAKWRHEEDHEQQRIAQEKMQAEEKARADRQRIIDETQPEDRGLASSMLSIPGGEVEDDEGSADLRTNVMIFPEEEDTDKSQDSYLPAFEKKKNDSAEGKTSPYLREQNEMNNSEAQAELRNKYHGNDQTVSHATKKKKKKGKKGQSSLNPVDAKIEGDKKTEMKVNKMGEYFSFRAKHKIDLEKYQERRRVPTGAQSGGGLRNYKRLAKQKRKRFKSVEQPATKSEKLQLLEAKVRESQLVFDRMEQERREKKKKPSPGPRSTIPETRPPHYAPLAPEQIIQPTSNKPHAETIYQKHWGQHAPETFGKSLKRDFIDTRTISTQTPSVLPGLVNVLGDRQTGSSPKTIGELLRYSAPTVTFPKLQTLSRSPAKRMLKVKAMDRNENLKFLTTTSKGKNLDSGKSRNYKLCESVLLDVRRFVDQDRAGAQRVFQQVEKNGDGSIGVDELEECLRAIGMKTNKSKLKWVIKAFRRKEEDNFINYFDVMRGVRSTLCDPVMFKRMIETAIKGKSTKKFLLDTKTYSDLTMKAYDSPSPKHERNNSPSPECALSRGRNTLDNLRKEPLVWTIDIRREVCSTSRVPRVVDKKSMNQTGVSALKQVFLILSKEFFYSCFDPYKTKDRWEHAHRKGDIKVIYMGPKGTQEIMANIYTAMIEPARRAYKRDIAKWIRLDDLDSLMDVLNDALVEPRTLRLASEKVNAIVEISFKEEAPSSALPQVVHHPEIPASQVEGPEADTSGRDRRQMAEGTGDASKIAERKRKNRMSFILNPHIQNVEDESKFVSLTDSQRTDLFKSTASFLDKAAIDAEKKRKKRIHEQQRRASEERAMLLRKQAEEAAKQQRLQEERNRSTVLAREKEIVATTSKEDAKLNKKTIMTFDDAGDRSDDDQEDDYEDDYEEEDDDFEADEEVDLSEEMKRAQNAERAVSRQEDRLNEMEQSLTRIAAEQLQRDSSCDQLQKQEAPSAIMVKPSFAKKKAKKKYY